MKMHRIFIILFLGIPFFAGSCIKNNSCDNTMCTMEYKTISIILDDITMPPVARTLTKFYTRNKANDTLINTSGGATPSDFDRYRLYGYPVVSDGQIPKQTDSLTVEFFGEINDVVVVQETFVVGHDCCHIFKIRGKERAVFAP